MNIFSIFKYVLNILLYINYIYIQLNNFNFISKFYTMINQKNQFIINLKKAIFFSYYLDI